MCVSLLCSCAAGAYLIPRDPFPRTTFAFPRCSASSGLFQGGFLATGGLALKHTPVPNSQGCRGSHGQFGAEMPVKYSALSRNTWPSGPPRHCSTSVMQEIKVRGPQALPSFKTLPRTTFRDSKLARHNTSACHCSAVDDCILHKLGDDHYFICVNAANTDKDFGWIQQHSVSFGTDVRNVSADYSQLALQGPRAARFSEKSLRLI